MISHAELTIMIPAFNEAHAIRAVLQSVHAQLPGVAIVVVDDASTDGTAAQAEMPGVRVLRHPINRGNGACVKTALKAVTTPYMAVIDADGQHDPAQLPTLMALLPDYDLVIGARTTREGHMNWLRAWGNQLLQGLASSLAKQHIPDLTSGFRVFKRDVVAQFSHLYPEGFSFPTTSTLACMTNGYAVTFVPVTMPPRMGGTSKIRVLQDGLRFIRLIMRMISIFAPSRIMYPLSALDRKSTRLNSSH